MHSAYLLTTKAELAKSLNSNASPMGETFVQRNHLHKTLNLLSSTFLTLTLLGVQTSVIQPAQAAVVTSPLVLAPAGPVAITYPACGSIQTCIDNAVAGDTIDITAGTYTDSFTLNKAVSLVGQGAGATFVALSGQRVLTITDASMTQTTQISNLVFSGGNITTEVGGGIRIIDGAPLLSNVTVTGNIGSDGGGIYSAVGLHAAGLTLRNNQAIGFIGAGEGGGANVRGRAVITGMQVISNAATGNGAGLYLENGHNSIIQASRFDKNKTPGEGGGLYLNVSDNVLLLGDRFFDNSGAVSGGGAYFESSKVNMDNNVFAFNYGTVITQGVELGLGAGPFSSIVNGRHNTFSNARSSATSMRAIELGADIADTVYLTNTIFDKYNVAIKVLTNTSDVKLNGVLWSSITQLWAGANVTHTNAITGLAAFADFNNRDFRISSSNSSNLNMIDQGVPSGLLFDFEEYARPHGYGFDLGADEINRKPVATYDSIINTTVNALVVVSPSGAGVFDPDGDTITYTWSQLTGIPVAISDPYSTTFTFTAPPTITTASTDPQFQIVITDTSAGGETITKRVRVKVLLSDTPITGVVASNDSPKFVTETVTLSATVAAGTNVTYRWDFGDNSPPTTPVAGMSSQVTHTYPTTGTFTAIFTATNPISTLSASTVVTITAAAPQQPAERKIYLPMARK